MKVLKGLSQFRYYDANKHMKLTVSSDMDYFKNNIHRKKHWKDTPIDLSLTPDTAAFDSGIVCAEERDLPLDKDELSQLHCFFAPYKLMQTTIGTIKKPCKKNENPNTDGLGIGIGMVLSIIAAKGSAENDNRTPYMLFVERGTLGMRDDQLDVPVVEGLNCGDFQPNYTADLEEIAKRALAEERGLNVEFLLSKGLLHMPETYYLGYDASYCQWNFFGTVVIDCTVEEIIREGCYYTKDKFETKKIIGIPAEPKILYYYLSSNMLPIHKHQGKKDKTVMWNTAWASVMFAMRDHYEKKAYKAAERNCLRRKNHPLFFNGCVRSVLNRLASALVFHKHGLELACAVLSLALIALFVLPFVCQMFEANTGIVDVLNVSEKLVSLLTALLASWIVVAVVRHDIVNRKDIVELNTYWQKENAQAALIPEISVFRKVVLKDGNIAENVRKVGFHYQPTSNMQGTIVPQRQCQMSYTQADGDSAWRMHAFTDHNIEDVSWVIQCYDKTKNHVRIVAPLIVQKRNILFKRRVTRKSTQLSHCVDFEIPYTCFVGKSDKAIKHMITRKIKKHIDSAHRANIHIQFQFLLEYNGQSVIVAFLESHTASKNTIPLTHNLTETTFAQNMKDDVTRVACEYAIAEYIGYTMSTR